MSRPVDCSSTSRPVAIEDAGVDPPLPAQRTRQAGRPGSPSTAVGRSGVRLRRCSSKRGRSSGDHHVQAVEGLGQQVLARPADISAIGLVDEGQPPLGQLPQNELGLGLDQRAVARLALAQRELGLLALRDVATHRLDLDQLPSRSKIPVSTQSSHRSEPSGRIALTSIEAVGCSGVSARRCRS